MKGCFLLLVCAVLCSQGVRAGGITLNITTQNVSANVFNGYTIVYNGSITVSATGGTAPYAYTVAGSFGPQNNGYFPNMPPGNYHVVVTDAGGGSVVEAVTVASDYPVPSLALTGLVLPSTCNSTDGSLTMQATGGTPPYTYSLDGGVTFVSNPVFSGLTQGYYSMCIARDANGMLAVAETYPLYISSEPRDLFFTCDTCTITARIGLSQVVSCTNQGSLQLTARGGIAPMQYSIDGIHYFPAVVADPVNLPDGAYTFYGLAPGLYHLYARDALGRTVVQATEVGHYCNVSLTYDSLPAGCGQDDGSVILHATGGFPPYQFTLNGATFQNDSVFAGLPGGKYRFLVRDAAGTEASVTATVTAPAAPVVLLGGDTALCPGDSLLLRAPPGFMYTWQDGSTAASFTVRAPGTYSVMVAGNGCTVNGSIDVTYLGNCGAAPDTGCILRVPGAFTPNGDGHNDVFLPAWNCPPVEYQLTIYNRWGNTVFQTDRPTEGWDGTMDGHPQPTGVYIWQLTYRTSPATVAVTQRGAVLLAR